MKKLLNLILLSGAAAALSAQANAQFFWGVTTDNELVSFDAGAPGSFLSSHAITGLKEFDGVTDSPYASILNIARNPLTNSLFGLDTNANLYSIGFDGIASFVVNTSIFDFDGGFDFDPFFFSFRFLGASGDNFVLETDGTEFADPAPLYGPLDPNDGFGVSVVALGINSYGETFVVDDITGTIATSYAPDLSEFFTVGAIGVPITGLASLAFDASDDLYAALSSDALSSKLYRIDTFTGAATLVGDFGVGLQSFTSGIVPVPEPSTTALMGAGLLVLVIAYRRRFKANTQA